MPQPNYFCDVQILEKDEQKSNNIMEPKSTPLIMNMEQKSIPLPRKFGYSIGHCLNDLTGALWFSYLITYFHEVKHFDDVLAGYLMLIGQVADAVFTPLIGHTSDKYGGCCFGKRKSWHMIGACCIVISFPFIFMECLHCSEVPDWAQFVFYVPLVILFQFGWAAVQISHLSMIPEMTRCLTERVQLNGFRYATTVMSSLCIYLLAWLLFYLHKDEDTKSYLNEEDDHIFRDLAIIAVGVGTVACVLFYVLVKEDRTVQTKYDSEIPKTVDKLPEKTEKDSPEIKILSWKHWLKNPEFYQICVIYMCTRLVVNISQIYMPMYITESLHMQKDSVAIVPLVVYASGFFTSLLMRFINKRLGRKRTYAFGQVCTLGACVWIYFISTDSAYQIYGASALIGIGGSTVLVTSLAMTSDLIGNNTTSVAFVYGAMSFTDKLSNGIAVVLIQRLNTCRSSSSSQFRMCTEYYRNVLIGVPGGMTIVAFITLLTLTIKSRNTVKSWKRKASIWITGNESIPESTNM